MNTTSPGSGSSAFLGIGSWYFEIAHTSNRGHGRGGLVKKVLDMPLLPDEIAASGLLSKMKLVVMKRKILVEVVENKRTFESVPKVSGDCGDFGDLGDCGDSGSQG
jgi:hypothetical protein